MNLPCPIAIHCGDYPFANVSAEGVEYVSYKAVGYCCDTSLKIATSLISQADAQNQLEITLATDCPTCSDAQLFCANASCPDNSNLTTKCVPTSQDDADALAAAAALAMLPFCDSKEELYQATCACPDGITDSHTTHSNISQAVATADCEKIPKTCPPPCNTEQCCAATLGNGTTIYDCLPAGTVCAPTLAQANADAHNQICDRVQGSAAQLSSLPLFWCLSTLFSEVVSLTGVTGNNTQWLLIPSGPPSGLVLTKLTDNTALLEMTPATPGNFIFTIRAIISPTNYIEKLYTLVVFGFTATTPDLPDGMVGTPYSEQIIADGGSGNYLFTITDGALPDGLSLGPTGFITGTPTTEETGLFTVTVQDLVTPTMTCDMQFQLDVLATGSHTVLSVFRAGPLSVYVGGVEIWTDPPKIFPAIGFISVKEGVTVCSAHATSGDGDYGPMLTCAPTGFIHAEFASSNPVLLPSSQSADIDVSLAVSPAATVHYDAASIAVIQAILPAFIGTAGLSFFGAAPIWMELYGGGSVTLWYGTVIIIQVGVNSWWFKRHDNTYTPNGVFYFEYGTIPIALTQITIS